MKIINSAAIFNPANNGFMYLCGVDDGTLWIRSVSGNWTQITQKACSTEVLSHDLDVFLEKGIPVTENDVKVDNSSQLVIPPIEPKIVPPEPLPDDII